MEKELFSVEGIIASAQEYRNDFSIKGIFQITKALKRVASNNKPFFDLELKDKTGKMYAKRFTTGENNFELLQSNYTEGNVIEIRGVYQSKWDSVNIRSERLLKLNEYNSQDFEVHSDINANELFSILMDTIETIENESLKTLLLIIFNDEDLRQAYIDIPASIGLHHSYKHGNLEHVASMMRIFHTLEGNYLKITPIDKDLVKTGIIIHDIGKTKVYSIINGIPVRLHGYGLIGHFALGEEIVLGYIRKVENFPEDLEWKIRHLILSHHGKKEYGSPVEPQIPEAEILFLIDSLDAKYTFQKSY